MQGFALQLPVNYPLIGIKIGELRVWSEMSLLNTQNLEIIGSGTPTLSAVHRGRSQCRVTNGHISWGPQQMVLVQDLEGAHRRSLVIEGQGGGKGGFPLFTQIFCAFPFSFACSSNFSPFPLPSRRISFPLITFTLFSCLPHLSLLLFPSQLLPQAGGSGEGKAETSAQLRLASFAQSHRGGT